MQHRVRLVGLGFALLVLAVMAYYFINKQKGVTAPKTTEVVKPSACWRWYVANPSFTMTPLNAKMVPGSTWTSLPSNNSTTPATADAVLSSTTGEITFPVDGLYSINMTLYIVVTGSAPLVSMYFSVITGLSVTNNNKMELFQLGALQRRHETGNMTISYVGQFKANDKIRPAMWTDGNISIGKSDEYHKYSQQLGVTLISQM